MEIGGHTQAFLGAGADVNATSGDVRVTSTSAATATADMRAGAGSAVAVSVLRGDAIISQATRAYVADASVDAQNVVVQTSTTTPNKKATRTADAKMTVGSVGLVGVSVAKAHSEITGATEAYIGRNADITATGGITVAADSLSTATAEARGGSGGAVGIAAFAGEAWVTGATRAYVDEGADITTDTLTVSAEGTNNATANMFALGIGLAGVGVADANALTNGAVTAFVGPETTATSGALRTTINATGKVSIDATSSQLAKATAEGGGGGLVGGAGMYSTARAQGDTKAFVGDSVLVERAGEVEVKAESTGAAANARTLAGTGGFISVGVTRSIAESTPSVDAYVGADADITTIKGAAATGNVSVKSLGRGEADANAEAWGGGAVQVGVARAESTVSPTASATVGARTEITAGGDVTVRGELSTTPAATPPSDQIQSVNAGNDTLGFNFPLVTGDVVQYTGPNAGLKTGREYYALVEGTNTIRLGSQFDPTKVDALRDEIVFDRPHNLVDGDRVRYDTDGSLTILASWQSVPANQVFVVRSVYLDAAKTQVDPLRIKLQRDGETQGPVQTFAAGDVNSTANLITGGAALADGQVVTYRAGKAATFFTESVDVNVIDRTVNGNTVKDIDRNLDANGQPASGKHFAGQQNIFIVNHGFTTGDAVTYRKLGSGAAIGLESGGALVDGGTYFVIKVDDNQIKLADSYYTAVGRSFDARGDGDADDILAIAQTALALAPSLAATEQGTLHSLSRNIGGLQNGQSYYVVKTPSTPAGTFGLASVRGGALVDLENATKVDVYQRNGAFVETRTFFNRVGPHSVGTEGLDLVAGTKTLADASDTLYIDLTGAESGRLLGPGGASLDSVSPPPGDGKSGATGKGGGGGFGEFTFPTARMTSDATATGSVGAQSRITAGGSVTIQGIGASYASSYGDTAGGGVLSVSEAHADTIAGGTTALTTTASVGNNAIIVAGVDFTLNAESNHQAFATARSLGGGAIAGKIAETTARLNYSTTSTIGTDADITVGNSARVHATSQTTAKTDSETYTVGIGAGADSDNTNDDRGVDLDALTKTQIGGGAKLSAGTVDIDAKVTMINADARAKATAYSPILLGVATAFADASVQVDSNVQSVILGNLSGSTHGDPRRSRRRCAGTPSHLRPR